MCVPQLTNDWHGMNRIIWALDQACYYECGLSLTQLFCVSVCMRLAERRCVRMLVCRCIFMQRFAFKPFCRYRTNCVFRFDFRVLCVYGNVHFFHAIPLLAFLRSLSFALIYGFIIHHTITLSRHAYKCVLVSATVALSHSVCIANESSYAGVLLQGSACYILPCV